MPFGKIHTRLHVEDRLSDEGVIGLDHDRAHFLRSVLRLRPGQHVALFNARDGEWLARIEGLGKGWCSLALITLRRPPESSPDLWLVFAPIKRARLDFVVEKATELGVSRLQPVITRHTAVERVNMERLIANTREAAEQCERLDLPEVAAALPLEKLLADWPSGRRLLVCAEAGPARPIAEVLDESKVKAGSAGGSWAVLVGPEGGFSPEERQLLAALPFATAVSLGPRILRSDTAGLAALSCLQARLGDWGDRPFARET